MTFYSGEQAQFGHVILVDMNGQLANAVSFICELTRAVVKEACHSQHSPVGNVAGSMQVCQIGVINVPDISSHVSYDRFHQQ